MIIEGSQTGPFPKEALLLNGLTESTPVWRQGMQTWIPASQLPELADLFDSAFGGYAQPEAPAYHTYAPGQQPAGNFSQFAAPYNWMPWAIVGTVLGLCSCIGLIFGILGIVNASKANNAFAVGDYRTGESANHTAKTMTIISLVFGGLNIVGSIFYFIFYAGAIVAALGPF